MSLDTVIIGYPPEYAPIKCLTKQSVQGTNQQQKSVHVRLISAIAAGLLLEFKYETKNLFRVSV